MVALEVGAFPQNLAGLGVEVAGRLVGHDHRRLADQRARDRDPLLLAARQLGRQVVLAAGAWGTQNLLHTMRQTGRLAKLSDRLGRIAFWLVFVGANLTFFPMHFSGLMGMPRRISSACRGGCL